MYVPVRNFYSGPLAPGENPTLVTKILAGMTTGALAISVANPTDVVKIRLQAQGRDPIEMRRYSGTLDCYSKIVAQEGVVGLWTGWGPNVARNSVINAAELASYDQYKEFFTNVMRMPEGKPLHFLCGAMSGFTAVCVGSPVDVMKTRLMNNDGSFNGVIDCFQKTLKNEGPAAFYKGFFANFGRLASWNIAMFMTYESIVKKVNASE